jgi:hypothetical protein
MKHTSYSQNTALSRRNFLRGLGACVALPTFASIAPVRALAQAAGANLATTATGAPLRTAFVYFPNGAIPSKWWPTGGMTDFLFNDTLKPLDSVRQHLQVVGGLDHENANAGDDGGGDHARGNSVFLTGVRLNKSATDVRAGISIDQVMANEIGDQTRFPSLELSCDALRRSSNCDSGVLVGFFRVRFFDCAHSF